MDTLLAHLISSSMETFLLPSVELLGNQIASCNQLFCFLERPALLWQSRYIRRENI